MTFFSFRNQRTLEFLQAIAIDEAPETTAEQIISSVDLSGSQTPNEQTKDKVKDNMSSSASPVKPGMLNESDTSNEMQSSVDNKETGVEEIETTFIQSTEPDHTVVTCDNVDEYLPKGWERHFSEEQGMYYYYQVESNIKQWNPPRWS